MGLSLAAIGRHFGVSYTAISMGLKKEGISTKNLAWGKYKWPIEEAVMDYKNGHNLEYLAKKYNVSEPTISGRFAKLGVRIPKYLHRKTPFFPS